MKEPDDELVKHSSNGRPLGDSHFVERVERMLNHDLQNKNQDQKLSEMIKLYAPKLVEGSKLSMLDHIMY